MSRSSIIRRTHTPLMGFTSCWSAISHHTHTQTYTHSWTPSSHSDIQHISYYTWYLYFVQIKTPVCLYFIVKWILIFRPIRKHVRAVNVCSPLWESKLKRSNTSTVKCAIKRTSIQFVIRYECSKGPPKQRRALVHTGAKSKNFKSLYLNSSGFYLGWADWD